MNMQHRFSTAAPDSCPHEQEGLTNRKNYTAAPHHDFTKRKNNICLTVLLIANATLGAKLALQAALTKMAAYAALAGIVASIVTQATVEAAVPKPQMKSRKHLLTLSASLRHRRKIWWYYTGSAFEYQHVRHFAFYTVGCFRSCGKLKRIPVPEMAYHSAYSLAEKKGISRRYQTSVEEFFLIPRWYQFSIEEFFLIPIRYQFQIGNFFLIPQPPPSTGSCVTNPKGRPFFVYGICLISFFSKNFNTSV
jgi:hypothetical protein